MNVEFDFNLEAWITNLEVEGHSYEDAKDNLLSMTIQDILEKGYVKDFDLSMIDGVIIEQELDIEVKGIEYEDKVTDLPVDMKVTITAELDDDIEALVENEIFANTNHEPKSFSYDIVAAR